MKSMEIEILTKKENPLLGRLEVQFKVLHPNEGTPKRDAVREELAKQLKATKEKVVVDHMNADFGKQETRGYAKIYTKKEKALEIEREHILKRNKIQKAGKKKEEAKEEGAEGGNQGGKD